MPRCLVILIALVVVSVAFAVQDIVTESPRRSYRIIQHQVDGWNATIHFREAFPPGCWLVRDAQAHSDPAVFEISSDDAWILRIQKMPAEEKWAWLYHVEPSGRVWRMEERLDDLAFDFLVTHEHLFRADVASAAVEFVSWDLDSHVVHFRLTGTLRRPPTPLERRFSYHLDSHKLTE